MTGTTDGARRHPPRPRRMTCPIEPRSENAIDDDITSIYQLLDAIEAVIKAADPAKREALTRTIDVYAEDFPEDFFWATGSQAPMLLHHLLNTIDSACRPEAQSKPRPAIRLVDRKPEGNV
jgi:hypothetical protein